jgi:hypothetical protein
VLNWLVCYEKIECLSVSIHILYDSVNECTVENCVKINFFIIRFSESAIFLPLKAQAAGSRDWPQEAAGAAQEWGHGIGWGKQLANQQQVYQYGNRDF